MVATNIISKEYSMQIIMNSSIAKLLNQSSLPTVIIHGESNNIWYNDAYIHHLKDYPTLMDALKNIFAFDDNSTYSFIHNKNNETKEVIHKDTKYMLIKEYRKSINITIISIIPEEKSKLIKEDTLKTQEYFFANMPQPCVIFDFKSRKVETANIAFLKLCGLSNEHIHGMFISNLFPDSVHLINNYLNSSTPYTKTFLVNQYNLDTNKIMIFEIIPIIKEENDTYKIIFMMRDIFGEIETQRDQISEDFLRYQFLTRSISDGMLIVNNGIIVDVNNAACQLWRYEKDELIHKPLSMLIPDASQYIDNASTVKGSSIRFVGIRHDKTEFSGALRVQAFDNFNKRSMVYIVKDLTDHIAVARLMESQIEFTAEVFDTQPNMIAVFNDEHMLTRCNKLFLEFFGYSSIEEAIHNIGDISTKFIDNDDKAFITHKNKDNWFILPIEHPNNEYMVTMKNSKEIYNVFNIKSTLMQNETNTFYVVSFTNITEIIERQHCLKEANNIISSLNDDMKNTIESNMLTLAQYQKLATIGTMISFITHQWKQPLNAIGLIAQNTEDILMEDEEFEKEDITDMMQSIMKHIMFMSETMENFKNFFKPEDVNVPFSVVSATKSIMSLLTPALKKSNIEVTYDIPSSLESVRVFGFVNDLKQVIMNIVVNGKDAIITRKETEPEVNGKINIKIENQKDEKVMIYICDNGTGLTKETLSKIFEMHYTTKGANGTGIGMYMAQMIIEKMKGTLSITNRTDGEQGVVAQLLIPIYHGKEK